MKKFAIESGKGAPWGGEAQVVRMAAVRGRVGAPVAMGQDSARDRAGRWVPEAARIDAVGAVTEDRPALLTTGGNESCVAR